MAEVRTTSSTGGQKGTKLARFDLLPTGPLTELAEHYGVGASKYADNQWRKGYEWSKSYAALQRHLTAFWGGADYDVCSNDPEGCSHVDAEGEPFTAVREDACFNHTGSHHLAAAAWHCFAMMEFKDRFPEHDDRYKEPEPTLEDYLALVRADHLVRVPEPRFGFYHHEPLEPYEAVLLDAAQRLAEEATIPVHLLDWTLPQRFIVGMAAPLPLEECFVVSDNGRPEVPETYRAAWLVSWSEHAQEWLDDIVSRRKQAPCLVDPVFLPSRWDRG